MAHWLICIVEDNLVGKEIISQVSFRVSQPLPVLSDGEIIECNESYADLAQPTNHSRRKVIAAENERHGLYAMLYGGLMSHHLLAMFPFCWTLVTHELSGICLFGLLIELPVLLLNGRDFFVSFEVHLFGTVKWNKVYVKWFWIIFQVVWHATRSASCVLYFVSLGVWRAQIHELLSPASRVIYHTLGILFNWLNFVLLSSVLSLYFFEDLKRCRDSISVEDSQRGEHMAICTTPPVPISNTVLEL